MSDSGKKLSQSRFEKEQQRLAGLSRADRFEELMEFPTRHLFKVIGRAERLERDLRAVLAAQGHPDTLLVERPSKTGRWVSLSFELPVDSGAQLATLYEALETLSGLKYLL